MRKFFRNERGQAFDVFKLLIAAIVAMAILWILYSIILMVNPSFLNDPNDEAGKLVSELYRSGGRNYRITEAQLKFTSNNPILDPQAIAQKARGISANQICVSRGDFIEQERVFELNDLGIVTFVGSGEQPVDLLVFCDLASQMQDDMDALGINTEYLEDCGKGGFDTACSEDSSQRCCIVAIKYAS